MSQNDEQPTSRRAARMVERERAARESGPIAPLESPAVTPVESPIETTAERAQVGAAPVVNDAIFANASWAKPEEIRSWAPDANAAPAAPTPAPTPSVAAPIVVSPVVEPALDTSTIVRRRDLRSRPADAPPVNLTGEVVFDRSALAAPAAPVAEDARVVEAAPAVPVSEDEPAVPVGDDAPSAPEPASAFAAPQAGAAPSWAGAAAPTSGPVDAVEDAPSEQTSSRRARRAVAPPEPVDETATMPPRAATGSAPGWTAPDGHWSRQLTADVDEPFESTFSRQVGGSAPTTNALVIPTAQPLDLSGPLTATGEIMLTGSIKLPDAFARTGATEMSGIHDRDDLDDLFDESPATDYPSDSQPIRAAAAVSGEHVLGSPIVSTVKPGRGNKVLTGLLITASALAVVVTGLIIAAFAFGIV